MRSHRTAESGFTLLELLLALALATLVFAAIAMAIDIHLRIINVGRTETEEAQLARAILRRMSDDLRGAVAYQVIDFSSLDQLASDDATLGSLQSEDDLTGADLDDESAGGGASGEDDLPAAEDEMPHSSSQDIASTAAPAVIPGVYGNQYELQIDVSRLPRPDEFDAVMMLADGASPMQIPSDIKTVSYYLRAPGDAAAASPMTQGGFSDEAELGGLVRREIDRAVARYDADYGDVTLLDAAGDVIAPEVTGLEFRYFDGVGWLLEWDSELMGGLPVAVEIALAITPRRFLETGEDAVFGASAGEYFPGEIVYRMVVRLPAAQPIPPPETEEAL
ncbi:MAG: type II secretion system protein GspJ [Planctomycetes bacterium]|nr:type II secretion system protein GspJ [Planctomycetota bacterium]